MSAFLISLDIVYDFHSFIILNYLFLQNNCNLKKIIFQHNYFKTTFCS
nr:MAG TPA: hypothetical protein [Caudoviricetes sp.]